MRVGNNRHADLGVSPISINFFLLQAGPDMMNFLPRKVVFVLSVGARRVVGGWTWTTTIREW